MGVSVCQFMGESVGRAVTALVGWPLVSADMGWTVGVMVVGSAGVQSPSS